MYIVEYAAGVADDLAILTARNRAIVHAAIDTQLAHEPTRPTRNRKIVAGLKPPWQHEEPVWQLRVGGLRVFYDVNEATNRVVIRAVCHKPPHKTTEEIL